MTTLEQAYNKYHEQIFNHALRVVKNVHDAEDIRSEVYVKIQRLESAQYDESKNATLSSWIHTITNSVIFDFFRTNHQEYYTAVSDFADSENEDKTYFNFVASQRHNADANILKTETRNRIAKALWSLKPNYRRLAYFYFIKDLPYNELAEIFNIPIGTVKGMLNRCRAKLQKKLQGVYNVKTINVPIAK
jgi:RNA polymerase sigma-70 factor, ECF subfamily